MYRLLICTDPSRRSPSPTPRPTQFRRLRQLLLCIYMGVYTHIQIVNPYSPFPGYNPNCLLCIYMCVYTHIQIANPYSPFPQVPYTSANPVPSVSSVVTTYIYVCIYTYTDC